MFQVDVVICKPSKLKSSKQYETDNHFTLCICVQLSTKNLRPFSKNGWCVYCRHQTIITKTSIIYTSKDGLKTTYKEKFHKQLKYSNLLK